MDEQRTSLSDDEIVTSSLGGRRAHGADPDPDDEDADTDDADQDADADDA